MKEINKLIRRFETLAEVESTLYRKITRLMMAFVKKNIEKFELNKENYLEYDGIVLSGDEEWDGGVNYEISYGNMNHSIVLRRRNDKDYDIIKIIENRYEEVD